MHLSVSARFTLKDRPKDYLGLCGEHYTFGKDKYISLSLLVISFLKVAIDYYTRFDSAEVLSANVDRLRDVFNELHFIDGEAWNEGES